MSEDRRSVDAPPDVRNLREDRLLRLVAEPPRVEARARSRSPYRPLGRARRGLELVLRRRGRVRPRMTSLPPLPYPEWEPTKQTLHLWAQIVGKVKLASAPPKNHWWHVPLYLDVHGLTTRLLHSADGTPFEIRFDFAAHRLVVETPRAEKSFALVDGLSVAAFDRELHAALGGL